MKKLISLFLSLVLALSLVPSAFAAEGATVSSKFTDVPANAWYRDELDYAVAHGYISGTSDTTFSPSANLTRAQFVTILGRMLNVDTSKYTSSKFEDVDAGSWYGPYVAWAADMGYVNGVSSKQFAPNNNLTFEQMGTIMANYISKSNAALTPSSTFSGYSDSASISGWAKTSMETMAKYDLLPVNASGNVRPSSPVLRCEAAVALVRLAKGDGKGGKPIGADASFTTPVEGDGWSIDIEDYGEACDAAVKSIHDGLVASGELKAGMSEKEKAIAYFKWMAMNCRYGEGTAQGYPKYQSHDSYGALVNKVAVCEGLAGGYKELLDYEGIECECVVDRTSDGSNPHSIVKATLDGVEYEIDLVSAVSSKNADGSFSQRLYEEYRDKYFYPDKWKEDFKPLEW